VNETFTPAELEELLGRRPRAAVGPAERAALAGSSVLVTGAAGTIGSALACELAACGPATLALVDQSELGLFSLERRLRGRFPHVALQVSLLDVTAGAAIGRACRDARPDVVYHAAAYKHVTMAERAPAATVRANVLGTAAVAAAAAAVGARFVLISTDKAANPESVMGATKRLAEMVALQMASAAFRPIVVRFGNVLGSSGSVLQVMRECVRSGRPIPLTDPEATRFFMTAGEAVALVIRADLIARFPRVFWLDMGEPVRMADLAHRLLDHEEAAGFARVPIDIIGLRPGEKRTETLSDRALQFDRTVDRCIRAARQTVSAGMGATRLLARARQAVRLADDLAALELLAAAVDEFTPSGQAIAHARRQHAAGFAGRRTSPAAAPGPGATPTARRKRQAA
jgi:O-antigen biosynthesis protein WbqV